MSPRGDHLTIGVLAALVCAKVLRGGRNQEIPAWLDARYGGHVGLNADWAVRAWPLQPHDPREGYAGERFVIDEEDGTWSVVSRVSDEDSGDDIRVLMTTESVDELQSWLDAHGL